MNATFRKTLICLVAVFALSAVAASTASAGVGIPEFLHAGKEVTKKGFTTKATAEPKLKAGGNTITCKTGASKGTITSIKGEDGKVGSVVVTYTGCKGENSAKETCEVKSSNTTVKGEIKTDSLKGELGKVATGKVGEELEPETVPVFVKLGEAGTCIPETAVNGREGLIGEATPLNTSAATGTLTFAESATAGKQGIEEIEFGATLKKKQHLEAFAVPAVYIATEEVKWEETVEVNYST